MGFADVQPMHDPEAVKKYLLKYIHKGGTIDFYGRLTKQQQLVFFNSKHLPKV